MYEIYIDSPRKLTYVASVGQTPLTTEVANCVECSHVNLTGQNLFYEISILIYLQFKPRIIIFIYYFLFYGVNYGFNFD